MGLVPPTPNTTNGTDNGYSNSQSSSDLSLNTDAKAAFSIYYENENIFNDTEVIVSQKSEFKTMSLLYGAISTGLNGNVDIDTIIPKIPGVDLNVKTDISADLGASLGRGNFIIKTSNVSSINNSDGSTTKTVVVDFTNKNSGKVKSDTVAMMYYPNGNNKIEHSLSVNFDGYARNSSRKINIAGQNRVIQTNSTAKLANGTVVEFNEARKSSGGTYQGSGSGTIDIKKSDGTSTKYNFTSSISATGQATLTAQETAKNTQVVIEEKSKGTASVVVKSKSSAQVQNSELNTELASETYATVK